MSTSNVLAPPHPTSKKNQHRRDVGPISLKYARKYTAYHCTFNAEVHDGYEPRGDSVAANVVRWEEHGDVDNE